MPYSQMLSDRRASGARPHCRKDENVRLCASARGRPLLIPRMDCGRPPEACELSRSSEEMVREMLCGKSQPSSTESKVSTPRVHQLWWVTSRQSES